MEIEILNNMAFDIKDFAQITPGFLVDEVNKDQGLIDDVFDLTGKDNNYLYYKQNFVDKDIREHWTWICKEACISIAKHKDTYISIIRNKERDERKIIEVSTVKSSFFRKVFKMGPDPKAILQKVLNTKKLPKQIKLFQNNQIVRELEKFEKKNAIQGFKFGILNAQEGQTKEEEMLSNVKTSKDYENFLEFLGTKIALKGWNSFRAGLDVKNGSTGDNSLFTEYKNNPIMFHVSTFLPYSKEKQQLERKRHICNDLVLLVFQEGDQPFLSSSISSRMVHVIFVVKQLTPEQHRQDPNDTFYSLTVIRKEGVPPFAPLINSPSIFKKGDEFRELLFTKLLNAERAIYSVDLIAKKMLSTRSLLLENLASSHN